MSAFTEEEIEFANKTCCDHPAFSKHRVVPRVVEKIAKRKDNILDFGAGRKMIQAKRLRAEGYTVWAYEFGRNLTEEHDAYALYQMYDIVYASCVLNIQSSQDMMERTVLQIASLVKPGKRAVVNYPRKPRKCDATVVDVENLLRKHFDGVEMADEKNYVWVCQKAE